MAALAETLAGWAAGLRFEDLPEEVVADTRRRILDTLGIIAAASTTPQTQAVRTAAAALGQGDEAGLIGFGGRTTAALAALVNGSGAHGINFDDTHPETLIHTSVSTVPVALSLGESIGASGRDAILAVALGNEANCRIGIVAPGQMHRSGFHPTSVCGTFAAALMAGRMIGLDAATLRHALGIAGSQAAGILESFADGTWVKTMHAGWSAQAGIVAAGLAAAGFTGPATVFEGRFGLFNSFCRSPEELAPERLTDGLGEDWEVLKTAFKPYPCGHPTQGYVDAALALRAEHDLVPEDIERVVLLVRAAHIPIICEPRAVKIRPLTAYQAGDSLPFVVAAALRFGTIDYAALDDEAIHDPVLLDLAARVFPEPDPDPAPPTQFKGSLRIETRDGRVLEGVQEHSRGSAANPMSDAELEEKFRANARMVLPEEKVERALAMTRDLAALPRIGDLVASCMPE